MRQREHKAEDQRVGTRDEVAYPTRGFDPDARDLALVIADISAAGFMATSDRPLPARGRLRVALPGLGYYPADIRWSEGDRVGCRFDPTLDLASYLEVLAAILADPHDARAAAHR